MLRGQFPSLKSTLFNIPIDVVDVCNALPCSTESNVIVIVKLKRTF